MTKEDIIYIYGYFHKEIGSYCHDRNQVQTQCQAAAILTQLYFESNKKEENGIS